MMKTLVVGSWVAINDGCPISYTVHGSGSASFLCGAQGDDFEFQIDSEALREYVRLGTAALVEMDALAEQEERSLGSGT